MKVWNQMCRYEAEEGTWDRARARMEYELMLFNRSAIIELGARALAAARQRLNIRRGLDTFCAA